jgi:hypothetical protein
MKLTLMSSQAEKSENVSETYNLQTYWGYMVK